MKSFLKELNQEINKSMYCKNCGKQNKDEAKFCLKCGKKFTHKNTKMGDEFFVFKKRLKKILKEKFNYSLEEVKKKTGLIEKIVIHLLFLFLVTVQHSRAITLKNSLSGNNSDISHIEKGNELVLFILLIVIIGLIFYNIFCIKRRPGVITAILIEEALDLKENGELLTRKIKEGADYERNNKIRKFLALPMMLMFFFVSGFFFFFSVHKIGSFSDYLFTFLLGGVF